MIATAPTGMKQRAMSPVHTQGNLPKCEPARSEEGSENLLADEKHVDGAEVENVEEWKRG